MSHCLKGCPHLANLKVSHCDVTDAGPASLAAGCPNFTSLDVSYCDVTDAGLASLADGCPNLVRLAVPDCIKITDAGTRKRKAGCPNLVRPIKVASLRMASTQSFVGIPPRTCLRVP